MKGLLLKDIYSLKNYMGFFLAFFGILFVISIFIPSSNGGDVGVLVFMSMMSSIFPASILAYEEKERWTDYAKTLPISAKQIVSCKYIISLAITSMAIAIVVAILGIKTTIARVFVLEDILAIICICGTLSLLASGLSLPLTYKYGAEKGRLILIGCFAVLGMISSIMTQSFEMFLLDIKVLLVLTTVVVVLFVLSWFVSIKIYKTKK